MSPLTGLKITASTFRLQERDDAESIFLSGTTHETFTTAAGHVILEGLAARQDDPDGAVAQCRVFALSSDGITAPIAHNTGVDFAAAPAPAFTSKFFMGPVYHNGAEVEGIIAHGVQTGVVIAPFRTSGAVYAKQLYIARRAPVLQLTTLKSDVDAAVNLFIRAASGVLALYYWKAADAAERAAVGTGQHLKISAATSVFSDDNHTVTENEDATCKITILPKGTLAYSITSTIP